MRFASLFADNLTHASIKVYLSAVRSLHIDHGLSDPFVNCLHLQRLLRGIKRVYLRDHLRAIQHHLDFSMRDHAMLWAACCLGFFGFLRAGEFTVNSAFQPSIHMTVADLQADSLLNPTRFKVHIKCSKTDPFRMGCDIYVGRGEGPVCPIHALGISWLCVALLRVLSLLLVTFALLLGNSCHPQFRLSCTQLAILAPIQAIASVLGQQLQLLLGEFRII